MFHIFGKRRERSKEEEEDEIERDRHTFSDEDRRMSAEVRRIRSQTRQIEAQLNLERAKAELRDLQEELNSDDEEEPQAVGLENMFLGALTGILQKKNQQIPQQQPIITPSFELSDEQIKKIIFESTTKMQRRVARILSDQQLKQLLSQEIQGAPPAVLEQGIKVFRKLKE